MAQTPSAPSKALNIPTRQRVTGAVDELVDDEPVETAGSQCNAELGSHIGHPFAISARAGTRRRGARAD